MPPRNVAPTSTNPPPTPDWQTRPSRPSGILFSPFISSFVFWHDADPALQRQIPVPIAGRRQTRGAAPDGARGKKKTYRVPWKLQRDARPVLTPSWHFFVYCCCYYNQVNLLSPDS